MPSPQADEEQEDCWFCQAGPVVHHHVPNYAGSIETKLCELCWQTNAGNMAMYPRQHDAIATTLAKLMIQLEWVRRYTDAKPAL